MQDERNGFWMEDSAMDDVRAVRKQFDISAPSGPQLELRLHWFGCALAVRSGYIVAVQRRQSGEGQHVASIAYEVPLPAQARRRSAKAPARVRRHWDA